MWVQQSGDIISATPLQKANHIKSIFCYLLPELRPDYLNKEGKKWFDHQSDLHWKSWYSHQSCAETTGARQSDQQSSSCFTTSQSNLQGQASRGEPRDPGRTRSSAWCCLSEWKRWGLVFCGPDSSFKYDLLFWRGCWRCQPCSE